MNFTEKLRNVVNSIISQHPQGHCMNMTSHMIKKRNSKVKNVKRAAFIKFRLNSAGLKLSDIASDLSISRAAVYRSINGLSTISRVDEWLYENLRLEVVND